MLDHFPDLENTPFLFVCLIVQLEVGKTNLNSSARERGTVSSTHDTDNTTVLFWNFWHVPITHEQPLVDLECPVLSCVFAMDRDTTESVAQKRSTSRLVRFKLPNAHPS